MKRLVVLSDIHFGNGNGFDIYGGQDDTLPKLIAELGGAGTMFVFNGDTFDFLMNDDSIDDGMVVDMAVKQAEEIAGNGPTQLFLEAVGEHLKKGGAATIRVGNHDVELILPRVQKVFRSCLPEEVREKLEFSTTPTGLIFEVAGLKVYVAHGDEPDIFNHSNWAEVGEKGPGIFRYPPGSRLVKSFLNKAKDPKGKHHLRWIDLLKPDFQGAVLLLLAIRPEAFKEALTEDTKQLLLQLLKRSGGDSDAALDTDRFRGADVSAFEVLLSDELTDEERVAISDFVGDIEEGDRFLGDLFKSLAKKLWQVVAKRAPHLHRLAAGSSSVEYFNLEPSTSEVQEAFELARKDGVEADVVCIGHTHAARSKVVKGKTYINTGTWINLIALPAPTANDKEWETFQKHLRDDPELADPEKGKQYVSFLPSGMVVETNERRVEARLFRWTNDGMVFWHRSNEEART